MKNAYLLCQDGSYADPMTMAMGAGPYHDELAVRPGAERQAAELIAAGFRVYLRPILSSGSDSGSMRVKSMMK